MYLLLLLFGFQLPPDGEPVNLTEMRRFLRQMVRECPVKTDAVDLYIEIPASPPAELYVNESQLIPITHEEPLEAPALPPEKVEETPLAEPERKPWGALTFTVFLLLLSLSVNVFLGWQLWEKRGRK